MKMNDAPSLHHPISLFMGMILFTVCSCAKHQPETVWQHSYQTGGSIDYRMYGNKLYFKDDLSLIGLDLKSGKPLAPPFTIGRLAPQIPFYPVLHEDFEITGNHVIWVTESSDPEEAFVAVSRSLETGDVDTILEAERIYLTCLGAKDGTIYICDDGMIGRYNAVTHAFEWKTKLPTPYGSSIYEENDNLLICWNSEQDSLFMLDNLTGALLRAQRVSSIKEGPLSEIIGNQLGVVFLGAGRHLSAIQTISGKQLWKITLPGEMIWLKPLPDNYLLACTSQLNLLKISEFDGKIEQFCTRYATNHQSHALLAVHPQNGQIAIASYSIVPPRVAILDPVTLEERFTVPGESNGRIAPIFWQDLLIHFPANEKSIVSTRIPY